MLIFHFDARYRTGILLGIVSALLAALFTITNKKLGTSYHSSVMLLYEMSGGFLLLTLMLPVYLHFSPVTTVIPDTHDFLLLLVFAVICTVGLYLLQLDALKVISAFTVNLSYNLESVYGILLAMLLLDEAKELNVFFYVGLALIILSVIMQTMTAARK
jgi:drug/metabolite transporter (DMT)-like permease